MHLEILFEAALALVVIIAILIYVVRLDRTLGRTGVDWGTVLVGLAAVGIAVLIIVQLNA